MSLMFWSWRGSLANSGLVSDIGSGFGVLRWSGSLVVLMMVLLYGSCPCEKENVIWKTLECFSMVRGPGVPFSHGLSPCRIFISYG